MEIDYVGNFIVLGTVLVLGYLFLYSKEGKLFSQQAREKLQQSSPESLNGEENKFRTLKRQSLTFGGVALALLLLGNGVAAVKWLAPGYEFVERYLQFKAGQDVGWLSYEWSIPAAILAFAVYAFFSSSARLKAIRREQLLRRDRATQQASGREQ